MTEGPRYCAVLRFTKEGLAAYVGHLDFARAFDRALRRARLPVGYTQGFNVHARLSFSPPLPVGVESRAELCVVDLAERMAEAQIMERLNAQLPEGVRVLQARVFVRARRSPLADITRAEYEAKLDAGAVTPTELGRAVQALCEAQSIMVVRRRKDREDTVDIRPGIHGLRLGDCADPTLHMDLSLGEGKVVRPAEVVEALNAVLGDQGSVSIGGLTRVALR